MVKKPIDLETLAQVENRPHSEIEQEVLRTIRALEAVAGAARLYSVAGPRMARLIQKRAMRSIQHLAPGEFVMVEDEDTH